MSITQFFNRINYEPPCKMSSESPSNDKPNDHSPTSRSGTVYRVVRYVIYTGLGSLIFLLFLPGLLATSPGTSMISSIVSTRIPGSVEIESLNLSWFSTQQLQNVRVLKPATQQSGTPVVQWKNMTINQPLWQLIWYPDRFRQVRIKSLQIKLRTDQTGTTNLEHAFISANERKQQNRSTSNNPKKPPSIQQSLRKLLDTTVKKPVTGEFIAKESSITINRPDRAPIRTDLDLALAFHEDDRPVELSFSGTIKQHSHQGSVNVQTALSGFRPTGPTTLKNLALESHIEIRQIPVAGIQPLMFAINPELKPQKTFRQIVSEKQLGSTLSLSLQTEGVLKKLSSDGEITSDKLHINFRSRVNDSALSWSLNGSFPDFRLQPAHTAMTSSFKTKDQDVLKKTLRSITGKQADISIKGEGTLTGKNKLEMSLHNKQLDGQLHASLQNYKMDWSQQTTVTEVSSTNIQKLIQYVRTNDSGVISSTGESEKSRTSVKLELQSNGSVYFPTNAFLPDRVTGEASGSFQTGSDFVLRRYQVAADRHQKQDSSPLKGNVLVKDASPITFEIRDFVMEHDSSKPLFSPVNTAMNIRVRSHQIHLYDSRLEEHLKMTDLDGRWQVNSFTQPIPFELQSSTSTYQTPKNQKQASEIRNGNIHVDGSIPSLFQEGWIYTFYNDGTIDWKHLTGDIDVKQFSAPVYWFEDYLTESRSISNLFGPSVRTSASMKIQNGNGPVQLRLSGKYATLNIPAEITTASDAKSSSKKHIRLREDASGTLHLHQGLTRQYLRSIHFLLGTAIESKKPISLSIASEKSRIPLPWRGIASANIKRAQLDIGNLKLSNRGPVLGLIQFARQFTDLKEVPKHINASFSPLVFQLRDGIVTTDPTEISLHKKIHLRTEGSINLNNNSIHMTLAIQPRTLRKTFGLEELPNDFSLKIPVRGTISDPKPDWEKAANRLLKKTGTSQLSELIGKELEGESGSKAVKLLGELLNQSENSDEDNQGNHGQQQEQKTEKAIESTLEDLFD